MRSDMYIFGIITIPNPPKIPLCSFLALVLRRFRQLFTQDFVRVGVDGRKQPLQPKVESVPRLHNVIARTRHQFPLHLYETLSTFMQYAEGPAVVSWQPPGYISNRPIISILTQ